MISRQRPLLAVSRFRPRGLRAAVLIVFVAAGSLGGNLVLAAGDRLQETVHHDLNVRVEPGKNFLSVVDTVTFPPDGSAHWKVRFGLNRRMKLEILTPDATVTSDTTISTVMSPIMDMAWYSVRLPAGERSVTFRYEGVIDYPLADMGEEHARGFKMSPGLITKEGVYLSGASGWYPYVENAFVTFSLTVDGPLTWESVSQGRRVRAEENGTRNIVAWECRTPQDEIYLVAGPFTRYSETAGDVKTMAYLRTPDDQLAAKYLEVTAQYLGMYSQLIGPYPYSKFALVENFWETGLGMPSFTLLGTRIIRFPFILHSSYPHEILHNWWGNSVYPDYGKGNWSEGLTAYLADHLIKEQQGKGPDYRLNVLQKYADYVSAQKDFPLTEFTSRHSTSTEAVGYGKGTMLFHMIRRAMGDEAFIRGLQDFYRNYRFQSASFDDLLGSLDEGSGLDLTKEFRQWITRPGAPRLKVGSVSVTESSGAPDSRVVATITLEQEQPGEPFLLRVPVAFTVAGRRQALQTVLTLEKRVAEFQVPLPASPTRIDVDPEFDLFRRVDLGEVPPAISQSLGSSNMLVVLPSDASAEERKAYRHFAGILAGSGPDTVQVVDDRDLGELPDNGAVCLLGAKNRFATAVKEWLGSTYGVAFDTDAWSIDGAATPLRDHSFVFALRKPGNPAMPLLWIVADPLEALPGLGRKLPHYHKYSFLAFFGREPENVAKGRWPVTDSPMTVFFPGNDSGPMQGQRVPMGELAPRDALGKLPELFSVDKMVETTEFLAAQAQAGRAPGTEGIERSADYIAAGFRNAGLKAGGDEPGSYFQVWVEDKLVPGGVTELRNVVGILPGSHPRRRNEAIVIGAHYDHLGRGWPEPREERYRGQIHPGADDNGSGVAILLELARVLGSSFKPDRTLVFVAFTGEEAGRIGSRHYVGGFTPTSEQRVFAMLNLDTVGRLGQGKLFVIGGDSAREWVHIFRGVGSVTGVDIQLVSEPLDASDQVSFQEAGIPAVQLFAGPHADYHRPSDTPDKVDRAGLVKVATVARETVEYLAARDEVLTVDPASGDIAEGAEKQLRRISLGIIPDFGFQGTGCRLSGVLEGSPAQSSGLQEGDIVVRVGEELVGGLQDLSLALKSLSPGDRVNIVFIRDGAERTVSATVVSR